MDIDPFFQATFCSLPSLQHNRHALLFSVIAVVLVGESIIMFVD